MKGNKILLIGIILALIFSSISMNVSSFGSGEQTDYVEDFEDDTLTQQSSDSYYGTTWINSYTTGANSYVHNGQVINGKSYRIYRNQKTHFNFTYSENSMIKTIRFRLYCVAPQTNLDRYVYFYNSTNAQIFKIEIGGNIVGNDGFYWSELGSYVLKKDNCNYGEFLRINITINDNDSTDVSLQRASGTNLWSDADVPPNIVTDDNRIVRMYVGSNQDLANADNWIDNIEIEFGAFDEQEEDEDIPPCCPFCDEIGAIGMGGIVNYRYFNQAPLNEDILFLYTEYNVPVTGNLTRIDLQIHEDMATQITASEIWCKVNNYALGQADELVRIGSTDYWRLSWSNMFLDVDNEPLYFMFRSYASFSIYGDDATWGLFSTNYDLNEDGQQLMAFLSDRFTGIWQTFHTGNNYKNVNIYATGGEPISNDVMMRLCFDPIDTSWELQDFTNQIILGDSPICTNTSMSITYFINNTAMLLTDKYIYIDKQGSGVVSGYPITLYTQDDSFYYTPTTQGTYYVNLSLDGVNVTSETFIVNCDKTSFIYTDPNPSVAGQKVKIYYGYDYATYNASLSVRGTDKQWLILPLSSGFKETTFSMSGVKYLIELKQYNHVLNRWFDVDSHLHEVSSDLINSLNVNPTVIELKMFTMISGSHAHFGQEVWVKVGDSYIRNVGNSDDFSFPYYPENGGKYDVQLILKKGNEEIPLTPSVELTVGGEASTPPEPDWKSEWGIDEEKGMYLGWGIVLIFILVPLKAKGKYEEKFHKEVKFPAIVYLASACTGVGVSVGLGLLNIWWILLIVVVSTASLLYMVFYAKKD